MVANTDDANSFVSNLSTMSAYNDLQAQLFDSFTTEAKALDIRQKATAQRAAEIQKKQDQLAAEKKTIDTKLGGGQGPARRAQGRGARGAAQPRLGAAAVRRVDASGRAAAAIRYAMAQVGNSYVYGAAGPNAFDCSGLTMMAWAQAGVSLPHSSGAQYGVGPHVASSDLQPGDLVFYYSPISHVGDVHRQRPDRRTRPTPVPASASPASSRCRTSARFDPADTLCSAAPG